MPPLPSFVSVLVVHELSYSVEPLCRPTPRLHWQEAAFLWQLDHLDNTMMIMIPYSLIAPPTPIHNPNAATIKPATQLGTQYYRAMSTHCPSVQRSLHQGSVTPLTVLVQRAVRAKAGTTPYCAHLTPLHRLSMCSALSHPSSG